MHKRLSVNALSTLHWSFDQDIEFWQAQGVHSAGLLISKIEDDVAGKLTRLKTLDIEPVTIVCGCFDLCLPESWSQHQAKISQLVDNVAELAGDCSIYFTPGRTTGQEWDSVLDVFAEAVAPCVEYARKQDVVLAFEPSLRTDVSFVHTLRDSVDVAKRTGLGIVADFANCWMERDLAGAFKKASEHIALVQIDDVIVGRSGSPGPGGRVNIGDGELPLDRLMNYVIGSGYTGQFDLEVIGPRVETEGYQKYIADGIEAASNWLSSQAL